MNIREMNSKDINECADILCSVYNNELWMCRWDKETAVEYLKDFFESKWWNNSEVFIEEMFVDPARQGSGIGTALLNTVEEYVKKHGLAGMTLSTNKYAPAPKFYKKNGFENCEHVIFMAKEM